MNAVREARDRAAPGRGLQRERTYLAWQRTGLSFAGMGALLIHVAGGFRRPLADVPGVFGLVAGAAALLRAEWGYRRPGAVSRRVACGAVSAATALLGTGALILLIAR